MYCTITYQKTTYTSKSNLERVSGRIGSKNIAARIKEDDAVTIAFNLLLEDIHEKTFVKRQALWMSNVMKLFKSLLPKEISDNVRNDRLNNRLLAHYGDSLTILSFGTRGPGSRDILLSGTVTLLEAIQMIEEQVKFIYKKDEHDHT